MAKRLMLCAAFAGALATAATVAAQAPAAVPEPAVLAAVQPGLWHVRMIEGSNEPERDICIGDSRLLVQLRHGAASCSRFVVADEPKVATISYTCPGAGSGRTSLRLSESGLLRIDSQGIADRAPFAFVAEARRVGACSPTSASEKVSAAGPAR